MNTPDAPLLLIDSLSVAAPGGATPVSSAAASSAAAPGDAAPQPRPLLHQLSASLRAGERLALIGESGSGKSLTALAITGLLPSNLQATGSIRLAGTEVIGATEQHLRPLRGAVVATVFQEPLHALDPLMRVGAQLRGPLARHQGLRGAAAAEAVRASLSEVQLHDTERIARAFPHELSGGQRQRVAIAIALACEPQLLIADEPTTALDVTVQAEVLELLDSLVRRRNMALLFISHDLAVVRSIAPRALVLREGQVVETGPIDQLLNTPQHPYTQSLVRSARLLDSALDAPVAAPVAKPAAAVAAATAAATEPAPTPAPEGDAHANS